MKAPVLAIGAGAKGGFGELTPTTMRQVSNNVRSVVVDGSGHFLAMEAPDRLGQLLEKFFDEVENMGISPIQS
ncbi:hypothetical protein [Streptomyces globisporus]|uniref:hypothetical protein n=1 Tax=Streptomyces globisporus TaxID=1908 RepID=UPI002F91824C